MSLLEGKGKVKAVVIDLSDTYRKVASRHFPNAKIIADRFHVVRLMLVKNVNKKKQSYSFPSSST